MPSQAEIEEYQQDVDELSALAIAEIAVLVMAVSGDDEEDRRSLATAIPAAMERYMSAAAVLAMDWYRGLARERPRELERNPAAPAPIIGPTDRISLLDAQEFEPRPADLPPREQIESTVWWALSEPERPVPTPEPEPAPDRNLENGPEPEPEPAARESDDEPQGNEPQDDEENDDLPRARILPPQESARAQVIPADATDRQARVISRLAGATQRYVTTAARDTVTDNATREGVVWIRHARPDACTFCRMLATRGPATNSTAYLTAESAKRVVGRNGKPRGKRKVGELYHDYCGCEPIPVRAGDSYEPPEYVTQWVDQYYEASDFVGNSHDTRAILARMRATEKARGGSSH